MSIRETVVEKALRARARMRGWLAAKFVSPGLRGVPDRIVFKGLHRALDLYKIAAGPMSPERAERELRELIAEVIEFVELKRPGEKAEPHQLRRCKELYELGFNTALIDSHEALEKWLADRS